MTLSLATYHPGGLVEVAPQPQPLYDAIPEDEHQRQEDEQRVKVRMQRVWLPRAATGLHGR